MAADLTFITGVSAETTKGLTLRGNPISKLIAEADFISTLYLSIVGRKPSAQEAKILNAVLVSGIELGLGPATAFVPRVVASSGADMLSALAATILTAGPLHAGAVTGAMRLFSLVAADPDAIEQAVDAEVAKMLKNKQRISGFGHAAYTGKDPRAVALFKLARQDAKIDVLYMDIARQVEHAIEQQSGRLRILNIDGAIAALLLSIGIPAEAGNALFAVSRVAGSIAHILEEQAQNGGVRRVRPQDIEYAAG